MAETYTSEKTSHVTLMKTDGEIACLDIDDELFFNYLKNKMNELLRQPRIASVSKIISYSKAGHTPAL